MIGQEAKAPQAFLPAPLESARPHSKRHLFGFLDPSATQMKPPNGWRAILGIKIFFRKGLEVALESLSLNA